MKTIQTNCFYYLPGFILLLFFAISGCKDDTDLFQDGSRLYIEKADSVQSLSGKNRVEIKFAVPGTDAVSAKIYWNNRANAIEVPVQGDSIKAIIEPLEEGEYTFEIITYDAKGNSSIPVKIVGTAYGSQYAQTLQSRAVKDILYDNGTAIVYWGAADAESVVTEVSYTDASGTAKKVSVPSSADSTLLENIKPGTLYTTITHHTFFRPVSAIDTIAAAFKTDTVVTGSLKDLAKAKGILFGSLISYGGGTTHGVIYDGSPNGIYTKLCRSEFNLGQATWGPTRWSMTPPSNFNDVNAVINWSRNQYDKVETMLITGPNNYMPDWFDNGTFTPQEMDVLLKNLVNEIMDSNDNKSKVDVWCVANELFNEDGTYRNMKWNDMGWEDDASGLKGTDQVNLKHPAFIGKAFQYCRERTNALLELRDYGIENDDPKSPSYYKYKAFYQLVKHLKATNRPVNVVGIQAHMMIGKGTAVGTAANMKADVPAGSYDTFKKAIKRYKDAGLDVYLTELDIVSLMPGSQLQPWTKTLAEQQRKDYYNVVKTAVEAGVNLISLWGLRDNNDPGWRVGQSPLLFDENYNKKPAYYGVQRAFFDAKINP
ncbi:hypothetical protein FW774_14975 [Pedobacter sp. BS3]|uniref:DUF4998 domain-containing protein n=1 Tax=Pedobacter sp. BS3 TaxID=2567937 RepID=UPI0011ED33F1|nr:DUF4998 domain-containing protein [Pedobacter sp. BS3]TZF82790.1 hypothetical protein FW774_14975 [Pedobacter sp. BS3]